MSRLVYYRILKAAEERNLEELVSMYESGYPEARELMTPTDVGHLRAANYALARIIHEAREKLGI